MTDLNNDLEQYIEQHSTPLNSVLQELIRHTHLSTFNPRMISGPIQGKFLEFICIMLKPSRVLEIGTFTGFSTICMAKALPNNAIIDTVEVDDELQDTIVKYVNAAGVADRVNLHFGDACQIVKKLEPYYDLVFIDGNKREYTEYYNLVFPLVKKGGFIIADNVLWNGKVVDKNSTDVQTLEILKFNNTVQNDPRVENVLLTLRDGLTLIHKL